MKKILKIGLGIGFLVLPLFAYADYLWNWNQGIVPCGPGLKTACTNLCQLFELGQNLIRFGTTLVIEILAPAFIAIGAFLVVTAADSPSRLEQGKKTIIYALIGLFIVLGAYVILNTFFWVLPLGGQDKDWANIKCSIPSSPSSAASTAAPRYGGATGSY